MLFCFLSDSLDTQGSFQHPYVPSNSQSCPLTVSQHPPPKKKEKKKAFCELIFSLTHSAYKAPYYILLWPSKLQRRVGHWGASALCSPEFFTLSLALPLRKIISRMKESDRAPGWLWIPVSMTGEATRALSFPGQACGRSWLAELTSTLFASRIAGKQARHDQKTLRLLLSNMSP